MAEERNRNQENRREDEPALVPPVDVVEDESGITLYADLPGVPKERLDVRIDAEALFIEGEMGLEMPRGMEPTHVEVSLPRYRRVFTLSKDLDPERMQAELRNGVLKLHIQKAEHARPRRIEIRGE
jgi:HSP20 family molecular chaperone IbpA